jgi:hypothetical protein
MNRQFHTPPKAKLKLPYAQTKLSDVFHWIKKPVVKNVVFLGTEKDYFLLGYDTTTMQNQTLMF